MWICTVAGGTAEVRTTRSEITKKLSGKGKQITPIKGRHGGDFDRLGDYLVNLWENVNEETRSLYDMANVATVKNPQWAEDTVVYGPRLINGEWVSDATAKDSVRFFRNYSVNMVMEDFWKTMKRVEN